jgi:hypothetical protein
LSPAKTETFAGSWILKESTYRLCGQGNVYRGLVVLDLLSAGVGSAAVLGNMPVERNAGLLQNQPTTFGDLNGFAVHFKV